MKIENKAAERLLLFFGALNIILYSIIFVMSPLNGEDYALTRNFGEHEFLFRLHWVINRSIEQSASWNARFGEQLAIFWLSMPKIYFALFSTVAFVLFNFLLATIISGSKNAATKTALSASLIFALWPGMEVFFWGTANAGYLFPLILTIGCVYWYRSDAAIELLSGSRYLFVVVSVAAFLAGLSFENTPVAVMVFMLGSLLMARQKTGGWRGFVPVVSVVSGWLVLILAPSTQHRRDFYREMYGIEGYSLEYFVGRLSDVVNVFLDVSWILLALTIASVLLVWKSSPDRKRMLLSAAVALLVIVSLVAAPYTEPRAFSMAWALMVSVTLSGLFLLLGRLEKYHLGVAAFCAVFLYFPLKAGAIYEDFANRLNERDFYIRRMSKTQACSDGIEVGAINVAYPYKYINNRDEWYLGNPGFISMFYQCKIVIK